MASISYFNDMNSAQVVKESSTMSKDKITFNNVNTSSSNDMTNVSIQCNPQQIQSPGCNESKIHDNAQKAAFHGMKSAYRMISSGGKGVDNPQLKAGARIAANVGVAYLQERGLTYDREESFDYIEQNVVGETGLLERFLDFFKGNNGGVHISDKDLEEGIDQAWFQINEKSNHDDGARTAIAIAEAYLSEKFEVE